MKQAIKFLIAAFATAMLSACVTAPGQKFAGILAPEKNQGDVYLYRTDALFSMGSAFEVALDSKKVGELYNASYLHLRLAPGRYNLKVSPGLLAQSSDLMIEAEPGKSRFYQYDFVTGPLANAFFIGSSIKPRDAAYALTDMEKLNSAK